ncbi:MAG: YlxR family protein [Firmicutes bacterium]|jgi:predicted RNA-binding protein YlxR (DUF448 family)|nr:YlxR family protein [Bacillota bacterium]
MRPKHVPMRTCVGCRESRPKKELIRIVRTPESEVEIDLTGKKSGRGAYLCPSKECLAKAVKTAQLERSLNISISDEIKVLLEQQLDG